MAGVSRPDEFQYWELRLLAEERQRLDWDHTALIAAACLQPHTRKRIRPESMNPWRARDKRRKMERLKKHLAGLPPVVTEADKRARWEVVKRWL